jgi:DivIVA domain-containing protein
VSGDDLVSRIRDMQFTPVRIREGYDMGTVDQLLDELEEAASRGQPLQAVVDGAGQFPTVTWREGYNMGEVDRFLAEIALAVPPVTPSRAETADGPGFPAAAQSVIEEKPGLLSRLFRRK